MDATGNRNRLSEFSHAAGKTLNMSMTEQFFLSNMPNVLIYLKDFPFGKKKITPNAVGIVYPV